MENILYRHAYSTWKLTLDRDERTRVSESVSEVFGHARVRDPCPWLLNHPFLPFPWPVSVLLNHPFLKFVTFQRIFQSTFTLMDPNLTWQTHFWPLSRPTKNFWKNWKFYRYKIYSNTKFSESLEILEVITPEFPRKQNTEQESNKNTFFHPSLEKSWGRLEAMY